MALDFLAGAVVMGFLMAGLFFLRFWKQTHDGLFLAFAWAFWLLATAQALLVFSAYFVEETSWIYLIRLLAYLLILRAIWRKNRAAS